MTIWKTLLLAIGVIVLALIGWLAFRFLADVDPGPQVPVGDPFQGTISTSTPTQTPASDTITIKNADGTTAIVPDFTKGRTPIESDSDTYYDLVHEGPLFGDEDYAFGVQYQSSNSHFLVSILQEPLGSSRTEAEAFLRSTLNLSNDALCKLNLSVTVTTDINSVYADKGDLGLSFCPGSVILP